MHSHQPWICRTAFSFIFCFMAIVSLASSDFEGPRVSGQFEWKLVREGNSSQEQFRSHDCVLNIYTVPWSAKSFLLMADIQSLLRNQRPLASEAFRNLKLRWHNWQSRSRDAKGFELSLPLVEIVSHGWKLPYSGPLSAPAVLRSVEQANQTLPKDIPYRQLASSQDLDDALHGESVQTILLVDFCGWNLEKQNFSAAETNRPPGGTTGKLIMAPAVVPDGKGTKLCSLKIRRKFSAFFEEFVAVARENFFSSEWQNFALLKNENLLLGRGIHVPASCHWAVVVHTPDSLSKYSVFCDGNGTFRNLLGSLPKPPLQRINQNEYSATFSAERQKPAAVLFIDQSNPSAQVQRQCHLALSTFRQVARRLLIESMQPPAHSLARLTPKNITGKPILQPVPAGILKSGESSCPVLPAGMLLALPDGRTQKLPPMKLEDSGFCPSVEEPWAGSVQEASHPPIEGKADFLVVDGDIILPMKLGFEEGSQKLPFLSVVHPGLDSHFNFPASEAMTAVNLHRFVLDSLAGRVPAFVKSEKLPCPSPQDGPSGRFRKKTSGVRSLNLSTFAELALGQACPHETWVSGSQEVDEASWRNDCNVTESFARDVAVLFTLPACSFCRRFELSFLEASRALQAYSQTQDADLAGSTGVQEGTDASQNATGGASFPLMFRVDCMLNDCDRLPGTTGQVADFPVLQLYPAGQKQKIVRYVGPETVAEILHFVTTFGSNPIRLPPVTSINKKAPFQSRSKVAIKRRKPRIHNALTQNPKPNLPVPVPLPPTGVWAPGAGPKMGEEPDSHGKKGCWKTTEIRPGLLLVATEQLSSSPIFGKSIILIVNGPEDGPVGLILNKPIKWKDLVAMDAPTRTLLLKAHLGYGGPVMYGDNVPFVALSNRSLVPGFKKLRPGFLWSGVANSVSTAISMVRNEEALAEEFWFFAGYSGWHESQLEKEIAMGVWHLLSCSPDAIEWPRHGVYKSSLTWDYVMTLF